MRINWDILPKPARAALLIFCVGSVIWIFVMMFKITGVFPDPPSKEEKARAVPVTGIVTSVNTHNDREYNRYKRSTMPDTAVITYNYNDKEYSGTMLRRAGMNEGDEIALMVDPEDPNSAWPAGNDREYKSPLKYIVWSVGISALMLAALAIYLRYRKNQVQSEQLQ